MAETFPPSEIAVHVARASALTRQLRVGEDWLVQRCLHFARIRGFAEHTPTLEEAWRKAIRELTAALEAGLAYHEGGPEISPSVELDRDPLALFAVRVCHTHRARGTDLPMFMGLLKYFRRAYRELVRQQLLSEGDPDELLETMGRLFDRIEQAVCRAWTADSDTVQLLELQVRNRGLTDEKNAYLTVFESLSQSAFLVDTQGRVRNLNHQAMRMLGGMDRPGGAYYSRDEEERSSPHIEDAVEAAATRDPEAMIGAHIRQLVPFLPPIDGLLGAASPERALLEIRGPTSQGLRDFQVSISPMLDLTNRLLGAVVIFQDVTERHELESHLRFLATTDALTGVANRRSLLRRAEHEFRRARRYRRPMALLLLDLDHFKRVNDTWGHFAGDEALKALCDVCLGSLRSSDMLGRLGGEEFAVLLPETGVHDACGTGERIRQLVEQLEVDWHGRTIRMTVSIGVATIEQSDPDIYSLMRRADLALYTAKDVGRNRVVLCADQPDAAKLTGEQVEFVLDDV